VVTHLTDQNSRLFGGQEDCESSVYVFLMKV
jgi:hypothetical protein